MAAQETSRPVAVIGAGLDLGAGRRGVDMGPSAIRYAGLQERIERLGRVCVDWGDVGVGLPEATEVGDPRRPRRARRFPRHFPQTRQSGVQRASGFRFPSGHLVYLR